MTPIAKEDITPGWYWMRERRNGELFISQVAIASSVSRPDHEVTRVYRHGEEFAESVDEILRWADFLARIEPPEDV